MDEKDLSHLTDEQLAARGIPGSEKELVRRYMKSVRAKALVMARSFPAADADDLFSEGLLGLLSAVRRYDPAKGAAFATFADVCVANRMRTLISRGTAPAKDYDFDMDELADGGVSIEDAVIDKEADGGLYDRLSDLLTDRELEVLTLYLENYSYKSAALKLGIDEKAVDNALQRAKAKIRRSLGK